MHISTDAELIAIGEQHIAAYTAYRDCEGDQAAHDVLFEPYLLTVTALDQAKPQTIAGMVAKARSARHEAMTPDGTYDPAHSQNATGWAWELLNDLLRLFDDAKADQPDAEVIALGAEIEAEAAELLRLQNEHEAAGRPDEPFFSDVIRPRWEALGNKRADLAVMVATTLEGFRAKALIAKRYSDWCDNYSSPWDRLAVAWSLANDLLGVPSAWDPQTVVED